MIICHPLKLIFLKTLKVGGTSFEVALSRFCGPECIITCISPIDERSRQQLGIRGPQNYQEAHRIGQSDADSANFGIRGDFGNHSTIYTVRRNLPSSTIDAYTSIAIHRDPAEILVSQYFFRMRGIRKDQREPFAEWYEGNKTNVLENFRIAPVKGQPRCDIVFDYANLEDEIAASELLPPEFLSVFGQLRLKGSYRDYESRDVSAFLARHGIDPTEPQKIIEPFV